MCHVLCLHYHLSLTDVLAGRYYYYSILYVGKQRLREAESWAHTASHTVSGDQIFLTKLFLYTLSTCTCHNGLREINKMPATVLGQGSAFKLLKDICSRVCQVLERTSRV